MTSNRKSPVEVIATMSASGPDPDSTRIPPSTAPARQLVLASGSPRRRELLTQAGYRFEVVEPRPEAECSLCSGGGPAALVAELAFRKAADVAQQLATRSESRAWLLLAADTVAECRGQILGKPRNEDHARQMLQTLASTRHRVYTGVCLWPLPLDGTPQVVVEVTLLEMAPLSTYLLDEYLATGQWRGKAGAFGYQDGLDWVRVVNGSESNVVGLPIERIGQLLGDFGVFTST